MASLLRNADLKALQPVFGNPPPASDCPPEQPASQQGAVKVNTRVHGAKAHSGTQNLTSTQISQLPDSTGSWDKSCQVHRRRPKNRKQSGQTKKTSPLGYGARTEHQDCEQRIRQLEQQNRKLKQQNQFFRRYVRDMKKKLRRWHTEALSIAQRAEDLTNAL
ncbi:hypothetical protein N7523_010223 [Penicillium sp. IBT 18751x]|nr:hypothetical protein N7523_010223 [Penicillium sp. IBT 18751x]